MEQWKKQLEKPITKIMLVVAITLIFIGLYLGLGLTPKNIKFYLPRRAIKIGTILLVSYCIGYSAVSFQTITNNRILTPSVMGLDSLYLFIQTFVVFFFGSGQLSMMRGYTEFFISVGAMMGAALLLFYLFFRGEAKNIYFLVLVGMILGNLFGGMSTFMQVLLDPNEFTVLQGSMFASFSNINTELFGLSAAIVFVVMIITFRDMRTLDVLSLGQDQAISLGVSYKRIVMKNLILVAVLISVSTVLVGPITFLGILVVNLSREMLKTYQHKYLIIGAVMIGALALVVGTFVVERIFKYETTISVIINFIGGLYFIFIMLKESRR